MDSFFCSKCGTLMMRISSDFPANAVLRTGTVDDVLLAEGVLKPSVEQFVKDRVAWVNSVDGIRQAGGGILGKPAIKGRGRGVKDSML